MQMETKQSHVREYLPNVVALWDVFFTLVPRNPAEVVKPYIWKGKEIIEELYRVARDVPLGANVERRVLVPVNPGLKDMGLYTATHTIYVGLQIVLPGEEAAAHRHTAFATRFMIRGKATTTVDGVKVVFEEGDFVTTPRWAWHDHVNNSNEPVVWLDALDIPIPKNLLVSFFENYHKETQEPFEQGDIMERIVNSGLEPNIDLRWIRGQSRPLLFKWRDTYALLKDLASFTDGNPFDGVTLTYKDKATGREISDTMGADITLLKKGQRTLSHRHTMSVVYYVVKGKGAVIVDGKELSFEQHDIIVIPPWVYHELANDGMEESILFSVNDRPLLKNLGLYREETKTTR